MSSIEFPNCNILKHYIDASTALYSKTAVNNCCNEFNAFIQYLNDNTLSIELSPIDKLQSILQVFYDRLCFSEPSLIEKNKFNPRCVDLINAISYRTAHPLLLAIYLTDLLQHAELNAQVCYLADRYLVRIKLAEREFVFIEPKTGVSLDLAQLDPVHDDFIAETLNALNNLDTISYEQDIEINELNAIEIEDDLHDDLIEHAEFDLEHEEIVDDNVDSDDVKDIETKHFDIALSNDELIIKLLSMVKASLIANNDYQKALMFCERLIDLDKSDPYLRRDRGYILEKLDCDAFALADYEYFVEQCPNDPIAQMLKKQLQETITKEPLVH